MKFEPIKLEFDREKSTIIEEIFDYKGFRCVVVLNTINRRPFSISRKLNEWRCGYVGVKKNHPFYKKEYDEVSNKLKGYIHRVLLSFDGKFHERLRKFIDKDNIYWFFGFNYQRGRNFYQIIEKVRKETFDNTKREVKELANQLVIKNLILKGLENENNI
jgi:hypothetical protein